MITKLEINNYESHKRTILEFPKPGLTVFIGESDRGKSGTFRAFNFARTNSPLGKGMFPLYWDGESVVKVHFDTGEIITRSKSESTNTYSLSIPGEETKTINAGTKVPEEIAAVFNMEEVNYQSQIDRAFLMFDTAGQRGRVLNKIVGLDSIDITLSAAKRDVSNLNQEMGNQKNLMESLEEQLQKYDSLPEINKFISQCEQLERMDQQLSSTIAGITKIQSSFLKKEKELKTYLPLDSIQSTILEIKESFVSYKKICSEIETISDIQEELIHKNKKAKKGRLLEKISELLLKINKEEKELEKISTLSSAVLGIANKLKLAKSRIELLDGWIEDEKKIIPKNCPACGSEVKL